MNVSGSSVRYMHFEVDGGIKINVYASINLKEVMLALDVSYCAKIYNRR